MTGVNYLIEADGGSRGNPGPAGFGAVIRDAATGQIIAERADFIGEATNNVAEYRGLIAALTALAELDPHATVEVRMDSKLVVEQMSGRWKIQNPTLARLAQEARKAFPTGAVRYKWIPREQNAVADALANIAMDHRAQVSRNHGQDTAPPGEADPAIALVDTLAQAAPHDRPSGVPPRFDDTAATTLVLVRHGVTAATVSGAFSGSTGHDPELTAAGRAQAANAAQIVARLGTGQWGDLPPVTAAATSPLARARETAQIITEKLGIASTAVVADAGFSEAHFGQWEGLLRAEIEAKWPQLLQQWFTGHAQAPGGESLPQVGERVERSIANLTAEHAGASVLVAAHVNVIRAAVGRTLGLPVAAWTWLRVPPASVTILRRWPDGTAELTAAAITT